MAMDSEAEKKGVLIIDVSFEIRNNHRKYRSKIEIVKIYREFVNVGQVSPCR